MKEFIDIKYKLRKLFADYSSSNTLDLIEKSDQLYAVSFKRTGRILDLFEDVNEAKEFLQENVDEDSEDNSFIPGTYSLFKIELNIKEVESIRTI